MAIMPTCDMCGKEERLVDVMIEGTVLSVCGKCSSYGKILKNPKPKITKKTIKKPIKKEEGPVESVVPEYSSIIRKEREKTGMNQKDFSKKINEKESVLHHIETGHFVPPIDLCRKLERILRVKLVEISNDAAEADRNGDKNDGRRGHGRGVKGQSGKNVPDTFTLGDFIKVKKR